MKRKIFKKLDKSKIKRNIEFRQYNWWLRSAHIPSFNSYFVACINGHGLIRVFFTSRYNAVAPVCAI